MGVASGSSECMLDKTHTGVINLAVAERASVAVSESRPHSFLELTTVQLPHLLPPEDPLGFWVAVNVVT